MKELILQFILIAKISNSMGIYLGHDIDNWDECPWLMLIQVTWLRGDYSEIFGGVLISSRHILTTASSLGAIHILYIYNQE